MARATRGLHAEMNQVFNAYILMVVTFAVSVTLSFWIVMLWQASLVCTCVFMYAARQWWFYCSRIYNRFYEPTFYLGERAVHFEERDPFTPFSGKEVEKGKDGKVISNYYHCLLTHSPTHLLTYSLTHSLTHSLTSIFYFAVTQSN